MDNTFTVQKIEVNNSKFAEFYAAIRLASRLLQAKLVKDQRNKELCACRVLVGDNPRCPIHKRQP